jgi:hypothetical protein
MPVKENEMAETPCPLARVLESSGNLSGSEKRNPTGKLG